jgi:hypothetical protein
LRSVNAGFFDEFASNGVERRFAQLETTCRQLPYGPSGCVTKLMQQTDTTFTVDRDGCSASGMVKDFEVCRMPIRQGDGIHGEPGDPSAEHLARREQHL